LFISSLFGQIEIKICDGYVNGKWSSNVNRKGPRVYTLKLNKNAQTLVKLEGTLGNEGDSFHKEGHHRVTWTTKEKYYWSNGLATDEFKVVNPASYSSKGKVYTMFGPLPEMRGKTVVITANYLRWRKGQYGELGDKWTDSIIVHLK
jgi:hypothetical protein